MNFSKLFKFFTFPAKATSLKLKKVSLSVSIITRDSGSRLADVIAQARHFADEVVIGVDADCQDNTWEIATDLADTVYRFKHPNQLAPAHMLPFQYCRGQWILRLDDDEHMEAGFEQIVPELLNTQLFTHYSFPRKWVVSLDPPQYMHASPWYPNWQQRLIRNDSTLVWKPPRYHSGYLIAGSGAQEARYAILHYEPLLCCPEMRAQKLKTYHEGGGNGVAEEEYGEKVGERRSFKPLPALSSPKPTHQWIDPTVKLLTVKQFPPWGCEFLDIEFPHKVIASQKVVVALTITNTGKMTWVPFQKTIWPMLTIGIHIKSSSGAMIEPNGPRIELRTYVLPGQTIKIVGFFTAPAEPGQYILTWDMVSEFECWFEQCGSKTIDTPLVVIKENLPEADLRQIVGAREESNRMNTTDYFFVVGCPRSGTTLLSVILDRHTRLCIPPETAFFDELAPLLTYDDDNLLLKVLGSWRRLDELKLEPRAILQQLGHRRWMPGDVLAAILDLYTHAEGKARCGEKTPQHLRHVPLILQQFPGAKIICMLRDGREVALSLNAMPWWRPRNLAVAADLWKMNIQLVEKFIQQFPTQFKVVRYEDLVTRPEEVMSIVMQYLGETFEPKQIRSGLPSRVVLLRSMGWKEQALRPIEAGRIGQRYKAATAKEIAFLDQVLGEDLRRQGYGLPWSPEPEEKPGFLSNFVTSPKHA